MEQPLVDRITREKRSKIMSAIRSENTKPEIDLRKELWKKGLRFRTQYCKEKVDIAFPRKKVAVFVDGCFWHGCPIHGHIPKSNENYWRPKLKRNIERDSATNIRLTKNGWKVMRFWEHELANMTQVLKQIEDALKLDKSTKKVS